MRLRPVWRALVGCALALSAAGCFDPVAEPDWWKYRHRAADGGYYYELPPDGDGDGGSQGSGCPKVDCGSMGQLDSADAVVGALNALPWTTVSLPTSICLPASDEVSVTTTITLPASNIGLPPLCSSPGACAGITFDVSAEAQGVTCLDQFCTSLMLNSARFRLRQVNYDQYPVSPRYAPMVQVLPPCGTDCEAKQRSCDVNQTCWADDVEYCRFCLAAPQQTCACVNHQEGQTCLMYTSNDLSCAGTCVAGACQLKSGQAACPAQ